MTIAREPSSLASIFPSPAMGRLVVFFIVHPGGEFHLRELMRLTRLPSASIQAELRRMTRLGVLRRTPGRTRTTFAADESSEAWRAWMLLLRACARPADVLREALVDAEGIEVAFVYGSTARGDARPDSDVDILLVGDDEARGRAERLLSEASILIERDLDVVGYPPDELRERALRQRLRPPRAGGAQALDPRRCARPARGGGGMNPRLQVMLNAVGRFRRPSELRVVSNLPRQFRGRCEPRRAEGAHRAVRRLNA
jgi:uncharacterized protein